RAALPIRVADYFVLQFPLVLLWLDPVIQPPLIYGHAHQSTKTTASQTNALGRFFHVHLWRCARVPYRCFATDLRCASRAGHFALTQRRGAVAGPAHPWRHLVLYGKPESGTPLWHTRRTVNNRRSDLCPHRRRRHPALCLAQEQTASLWIRLLIPGTP